ncbi:Antibiotic biosynthesis monooxygenase [Aspergillus sclerotialis]|uniref:Antibiotic biosynthesis monooxygenase n=1 Tax=Aspergillus sclerotialis TaxID=2070753 RepID=A0A3A2ZNQ0_9EURO|nr:Antibiotic biosynthesis monooxygenase [Aspergillus sclerotialis]
MSSEEVNLVAILYPKPERAGELSGLLAELTKKVLANEPDTLTYYAFSTKENSEIIVVERNQAATQAHVKSSYFQEFAAKVPDLVVRPMEVKMGHQLASSERVLRI